MPRKSICIWLVPVMVAAIFMLAGCKKLPDKMSDITPGFVKKLKRGPRYRTNLRLKVAILPFEDAAQLSGGPYDMKSMEMVAKRMAEDKRFLVVPWHEVEAYAVSRRIPVPITQNTAMMLGRGLGLNAVVIGHLSEVSQNQKKTGPLSFIPFRIPYLSERSEVITATLVARVVDVETGAVLGADVGTGEANTGLTEQDVSMGMPSEGIDDKIITTSMDYAVEELVKGIVRSLSKAPWKGFIAEVKGDRAVISSGSDVGIETGDQFVVRSSGEKILNAVGKTYIVPGEIKANVEAVQVNAGSTEVQVTSGQVHVGETVQAVE